MRLRASPLPALACLALLVSGCTVRETTTPRTATEVLLVSTAAERAIKSYDAGPLAGRRVAIDASRYQGIDKSYVVSALRSQVVRGGGRLVKDLRATRPEAPPPEVMIELRSGTLGIWDGDFVIGIPEIPVSAQGLPPALLPPLYLLRRLTAQGWAKFQFRTYDRATLVQVHQSGDLWGSSYYTQWWVLGIGPFDGSNDIYPDFELGTYVPGTATEVVEDEGEDR